MNYKTKYKFDDTVFFLKDNTIQNGKVYGVRIIHNKEYPIYISYKIGYGDNVYEEDKLFPSIQALKKNIAINTK